MKKYFTLSWIIRSFFGKENVLRSSMEIRALLAVDFTTLTERWFDDGMTQGDEIFESFLTKADDQLQGVTIF